MGYTRRGYDHRGCKGHARCNPEGHRNHGDKATISVPIAWPQHQLRSAHNRICVGSVCPMTLLDHSFLKMTSPETVILPIDNQQSDDYAWLRDVDWHKTTQ